MGLMSLRGVGPKGSQRPRLLSVPDGLTGAGQEAVELAAMAGLRLDPWQQFVLSESLRERPGGLWSAFEVGLVVPRQNGKGSILEARELAGLFLLGEKLIIHSAHQYDTSIEHFNRLSALIENTPEFDRRVKKWNRTHGTEGIELKGGQRIRFRTRTKSGGRGFTADLVVFDEAMVLPETAIGALMPTLSTRPNPQIWYAGSAVDRFVHDDGVVFSKVRARGTAGGDPQLAYFEWSVGRDNPDSLDPEELADRNAWASANPGAGIRIPLDFIENELRSMDSRTFAVERLNIGDWHDVTDTGQVITAEQWAAIRDPGSTVDDPVCFAFDVSPGRDRGAIGVAGRRPDGMWHLELVDHRDGTGWIAPALSYLNTKHSPAAILVSSASPAASIVPELRQLGLDPVEVTAGDEAKACGLLYDAVMQRTVWHRGDPRLAAAVKAAVKRPLSDAWAWSRKESGDITPLVAATLALWGANTVQAAEPWATSW